MKLRTALLLVALGLSISNANAQTNSWINPASDFWEDATAWSLGVPPNSTLSILITNAGNKTIVLDSTTSSSYPNTLTVSDLILAAPAGSANTLLIDDIGSSPPLHVLNSLLINPGGALLTTGSGLLVDNAAGGAVDVEGTASLSGTNFLSGGLYVGFATNSAASVSLFNGQTVFTNGYMTIGFYGSAQVTLLSGTLQTEDNISAPNGVFLGFGPGSQGTLSIPGGTLIIPEHLSLGDDAGSVGQLSLNGGQLIATNNFLISIGGNATGQVVVTSGQIAASYLIFGDALGSSGMLTLSGGVVNISGAMAVAQGQSATGSVFITGGQLVATNQSVTIGGFGIGQMTLSNGVFLAQSVILGSCENSQGTLTIFGGTVSVASNMTVGARGYLGTATNANANGTIRITGGSFGVTNQFGTALLNIGRQGSGSFLQNGGFVRVDQLTIATSYGSFPGINSSTNIVFGGMGQVILSNGVLFAQTVALGTDTNCQGSLTVAGGTLSVVSNMVAGIGSNAVGAIQIYGGYFAVTNRAASSLFNSQLVIGQNGTGTFLQNGGTATVDQLLVTNGTSSVFSLNSGLFNTGSTTVSNSHTFVIGDSLDAATYHLLGRGYFAGIHSFANGLEVRSNAVLSGCGTINGAVLVDPGGLVLADCGGTLTFTGIVTNNGDLLAVNGSTLESYGPVVNNGVINALNGNTNFHSGFINNGVLLDSNSIPQIVSISVVGSSVEVTFTTSISPTYVVEFRSDLLSGSWTPLIGFTGPGGDVMVTDFNAALQPQRFYRVRLVVPP